MTKAYLAEGYLDEEKEIGTTYNSQPHFRRLFICMEKELVFAKTNISDATNKNLVILFDDIQRLNESFTYDEIYLVGEAFFEIYQDTLEELKLRCYEIWTIEEDDFNLENILKEFTNKN